MILVLPKLSMQTFEFCRAKRISYSSNCIRMEYSARIITTIKCLKLQEYELSLVWLDPGLCN